MELNITVEDSIVCQPDTAIVEFTYFNKNINIEGLRKAFETFTSNLRATIDEIGLNRDNLEIGRLNFSKEYKNVLVEKTAFLGNKTEKVNERRPDGYSLSCTIRYIGSIEDKGITELYLKLFVSSSFSVVLKFECRDIEKYKDTLLEKLLSKGQHKAELVAKSCGLSNIKLQHTDFSVRKTTVSYSSLDCFEYSDYCDDSALEDFIDETSKQGREVTDNLTLTYEIS